MNILCKKPMYSKREIMAELRRQLKQYEASIGDLSPDERKALHEWVADGESVYNNPDSFTGEDGNPLCFIEAFRLIADMLNFPEDYSF